MTETNTETTSPILLDIVTVSYDSGPELGRIAENIAATTSDYNWIVIDNASPSGCPKEATVCNDVNTGFATACNQGASLGSAPDILFLNPDVVLREGWQDLFSRYASHKDIGIIGPTYATFEYPDNLVVGAMMYVRREVFEELGGFDPQYFLGWEDNDICHRAILRGYRILKIPLKMEHPGGVTIDPENLVVQGYLEDGKRRYLSKFNLNG